LPLLDQTYHLGVRVAAGGRRGKGRDMVGSGSEIVGKGRTIVGRERVGRGKTNVGRGRVRVGIDGCVAGGRFVAVGTGGFVAEGAAVGVLTVLGVFVGRDDGVGADVNDDVTISSDL
jgi:hypothetical protein